MTKLLYTNCDPYRVVIKRGKWKGASGNVCGRYSDGTYRVAVDGQPHWVETRIAATSFSRAK